MRQLHENKVERGAYTHAVCTILLNACEATDAAHIIVFWNKEAVLLKWLHHGQSICMVRHFGQVAHMR